MKRLLIVVDYQKDFVDGSLGFDGAEKLDARIAEKIASYRATGDEVAFTFDTHHRDYLKTQEGRNLPVVHCVRDTPGWELVPELEEVRAERGALEIHDFAADEIDSPDGIFARIREVRARNGDVKAQRVGRLLRVAPVPLGDEARTVTAQALDDDFGAASELIDERPVAHLFEHFARFKGHDSHPAPETVGAARAAEFDKIVHDRILERSFGKEKPRILRRRYRTHAAGTDPMC